MELRKELLTAVTGALIVTGMSASATSAQLVVKSATVHHELTQDSVEAKLLSQLEGRMTTRPSLPQRLLAQSL